ncbi:MAG: hypothetical protein AAF135_14735, partial [Bacteroidota bacterium]
LILSINLLCESYLYDSNIERFKETMVFISTHTSDTTRVFEYYFTLVDKGRISKVVSEGSEDYWVGIYDEKTGYLSKASYYRGELEASYVKFDFNELGFIINVERNDLINRHTKIYSVRYSNF